MLPNPLSLNIRHLRAVAAIVDAGTLAATANIVSLTQPALTQAVAGLEARLGQLFVRTREGMSATPAGHVIAARTVEAFGHLARGLRAGTLRQRGFAEPERLLTTSQVRALLALAEGGSFVAAARMTGLSQPALHRGVRDVERLTGVPLVERRGRGVAFTEAGRRAARGFRLAVAAIRAGLAELEALQGGEAADHIVVGAMPLSRARLLPVAIAELQRLHPNAHVTVIEGAHRELTDLLRDGRLDLTIGALRDPPPGADVEQRPLAVDRLAIVARGGHPLAGGRMPSKAELARYRWIVGLPGSPLREHWERMFADAAPPVAPVDCGSVMTIRGLLLSGDSLTLLSPEQVGMELSSGLLALVGPPLADHVRTIGITTRADWRPTPAQASFIGALAIEGSGIPEN